MQVGTYDPIPNGKDGMKELRLKIDRIKYWMSVGAQPSDMAAVLLWKAGLLPAPPVRYQPIKSVKRSEREGMHTATGRALSAVQSQAPSGVKLAGIPIQMPLHASAGLVAAAATLTSARASRVSVLASGAVQR